MTFSTTRLGGACLIVLLALHGSVTAQMRASERGSVSQTIDGTTITVDYARPQVRGRDSLFGKWVEWGAVWTPGANFATTLETNRPLTIDGHPVKPGKYSIWLVTHPDQWTLVIDPRVHLYHWPYPDSTADQIRFPVHPTTGPVTEMLTFTFQDVHADAATLLLRWGTMELPFKLEVAPKHKLTIAEADAKPLLGTYTFRWADSPDSVAPSKVTLAYEDGKLMGHWAPAPWPEVATFLLVGITDDWFMVGSIEHGKLTDVMDEWVFEFSRQVGRATTFEVWSDNDHLDGTGTRD